MILAFVILKEDLTFKTVMGGILITAGTFCNDSLIKTLALHIIISYLLKGLILYGKCFKILLFIFHRRIVYVLIEMLWRDIRTGVCLYWAEYAFYFLGLINKKYTLGYSFVNTNADRHIYHNINGIYLRVYF